jgi:hypothetical protein
VLPDISQYRYCYWLDGPAFESCHRQKTFTFSKEVKPALGLPLPPIQSVPGFYPQECSSRSVRVTHLLLLTLRISAATRLLPPYTLVAHTVTTFLLSDRYLSCATSARNPLCISEQNKKKTGVTEINTPDNRKHAVCRVVIFVRPTDTIFTPRPYICLRFVPAATRCDLHSSWKDYHFKVQQLSDTFLTRPHPSLVWRSVRYSNKHTPDSEQTAHLCYMSYSNRLS